MFVGFTTRQINGNHFESTETIALASWSTRVFLRSASELSFCAQAYAKQQHGAFRQSRTRCFAVIPGSRWSRGCTSLLDGYRGKKVQCIVSRAAFPNAEGSPMEDGRRRVARSVRYEGYGLDWSILLSQKRETSIVLMCFSPFCPALPPKFSTRAIKQVRPRWTSAAKHRGHRAAGWCRKLFAESSSRDAI